MQSLVILGSTGSIGRHTLALAKEHPQFFSIYALTAYHNVHLMLQQCQQCQPKFVVMVDESAAQQLRIQLQEQKLDCEVFSGLDGLIELVTHDCTDTIVAGIVGAAGLLPVLRAAQAGKRILLANKEPLIMCGDLLLQAVRENNAQLLPLDSEHNAIFQCLPETDQYSVVAGKGIQHKQYIRQLTLTASGGPFLNTPLQQLAKVTPQQACQHPNWSMGQKISIDSATLVNKGLELMEACYLFNLSAKAVEIVIHPQSIIHSLVEYQDGSWLAQLGQHDMRIPISYALAWPQRIKVDLPRLNWAEVKKLDFLALDEQRFPAINLVKQVLAQRGTAPAIFNAANEVAVAAFLQDQISFVQIIDVIQASLAAIDSQDMSSLEDIVQTDKLVRQWSENFIKKL